MMNHIVTLDLKKVWGYRRLDFDKVLGYGGLDLNKVWGYRGLDFDKVLGYGGLDFDKVTVSVFRGFGLVWFLLYIYH